MPRTKLDKIFDNKFHETDATETHTVIDFHSEHFHDSVDNPYKKLDEDTILDAIDEIVSTNFPQLKEISNKRINKGVINKIYTHIKTKLISKHNIIHIWNYVAIYFDIDSERFFNNLDDVYKNELILELKENTNLLDNYKIDSMF